ncbi:PKD domain-containing protein [Aquimarina sp. Aq78]|uniref:PKD domain-containing protein n=1 Tax=Aquimarina sp. Aq78 TaxID=1191889 RepID=UPI00131CC5C0|nr:PKD domain-containing protein [Aquimarina sp. Aq78]
MKTKQRLYRKWLAIMTSKGLWLLYASAILISFGLAKKMTESYDGTSGPSMTTQTWPAGTFLSNFPQGDRINTYHRNYLMIAGQEGTGIWDVSNPTDPKRLQFDGAGNNGHRWWKMGDLYYREYSVPEVAGSGYKYLDLSNMLERKPITSSDALYTVKDNQPHYDNLETFPHTIDGDRVYDMRSGEEVGKIPIAATLPDIVLRLGNYVFYAPQSGEIKVFDFGDPKNIKFLGAFGGGVPHEQYSTGFQVWRNYLIYMSGNEGSNTLVAFDISDPTNVKHGFNISSDDITLGRYMIFKDEFGFTGRFDRGVKYNFEKMRVEQEFFPPSDDETLQLLDNQWMPIGHILVASGDGKTSIFSHQDDLDTRPPTVGHHFPVSGATNQPVDTTIGFVINEILDDNSLNDKTIQVSPLGGDPIIGDVTSTSYHVINYAPREKLLPNTTYEVKFVAGGVKDAVGNGIKEYVFYFTTGGDASNKSPEITSIDSNMPSPVGLGDTVEFVANASDPDGNSMSYRWDFGDGTPKTDWIGEKTSHTFTEAGNYLLQVQVSDNNGGFSVFSKSLTIVETLTASLPTQSAPIAVDENRRVIWSVNPDNNTITLINADDLSVIKEVSTGIDPVNVAVDSDGNSWITCRDSDEIYVLKANGTIHAKIPLPKGSRPFGIVFTPDQSRCFVSTYGSGKILEISPVTQQITATLTIGQTPRALAVTGDGKELLVTRFISPDEEGQVWKIDLETFRLTHTITLPIDDFTVDNGNEGRGVPNYVSGISIHPNNKSAWSVAKKDNILRGLSRDGKPLPFDNAVRTAIASIDLSTNTEKLASRLDIDNHGQPSSALFTPTGNLLFLTMQGNNRIVVIDPQKGLELIKKDVGSAPQGMVIDKKTNRLFVKNFMSRDITVFDAKKMIESGNTSLEKIATVKTVTNEKLSTTVLKGKQIFYNAADLRMGTDGYISCASCHIDGAQDGRNWDFTDRGEGVRNTISLVGRAGTEHGRVHWSANFDEIQDFENDIRFHFKGRGFMKDSDFNKGTTGLSLGDPKQGKSADLDALTAYIESLNTFDPSPYRKANGALTNNAVAGKGIFKNLQCASCHGGNNFTDSKSGKMHDVGTITTNSGNRLGKKLLGIDTPTLRDVWATAPYLHTGAAATIEEVFTTYNTNDAHAATSGLSQSDFNKLIAYIKQIDGSEPAIEQSQVVKMASPKAGTSIEKSDPVKLSVNTNINGVTKIEYYIDGELLGEVNAAPFEMNWNPVLWKAYKISAKVFYNQGNTASLTPEIKVKYKKQIKVMFVVGDDKKLTPEDQKIKSRLEQRLGFKILLFSDEKVSRPEMANPYDMVLVSSSVDPGVLGNDLESAVVPIMTWDPFMYGKLKLTSGNINSGFGFTQQAYPKVTIANANHPLAAGLNAGKTALYKITQRMPFGKPTENAVTIAKVGNQPILFGYEAGMSLPSRRLAFPLRDQFMHLLTDNGWELFDAGVLWTLHGGDAQTPVRPLPDIHFKSPSDGELVNTPLKIKFDTEGWNLPSNLYKLRFKIDGKDRGLITSEGVFTDGTVLSEGPHKLVLQMERSNNSVLDLKDEITVIVTKDPLPERPTAIIQSPINGSVLKPSFDVKFSTYKWDIKPGGKHVRYYIDGIEKDAVYTIEPISIQNLEDGDHKIKLVLMDENGNPSGDPGIVNITVDKSIIDLPDTPFRVEYYDNTQNVNSSEIKPVFQIVSDSTKAIPYSEFKMRYWYTPEHTAGMSFGIDYTSISGVNGKFKTKGEEKYVEISFSGSSGKLPAKGKSGEIKTRIHHAGYLTHNQSNDHSYDASKKTLKPHVKATLYHKGKLVWGMEPKDESGTPVAVISTSTTSGKKPLEVRFDASGSSDPDGDLLTYTWDFGNGETSVEMAPVVMYTEIGSYLVSLSVSDGIHTSVVATETITVIDDNSSPIADFTADPTIGVAPLLVSLDGSSSSDPDGDTLTHTWDFGNGKTGTGTTVTHEYDTVGDYVLQLTVSDGKKEAHKTITIKVSDGKPIASFTADPESGISPLLVNFDASSSVDPSGGVLSYSWDLGNGVTSISKTPSATYTVPEEVNITLTVTNQLGKTDTVSKVIKVIDGTVGCNFGVPLDTALPSLNQQYDTIHVLGDDGPNLDNIKSLTINWDSNNNGLYQFSLNTNNGTPDWYVDLLQKVTHSFNAPKPEVQLSTTGINGLDGSYYATTDEGNLVLVSKNNNFTLYCSTSSTPPDCQATNLVNENTSFLNRYIRLSSIKKGTAIKISPNPVRNKLFLHSFENLQGSKITITNITGDVIKEDVIHENSKEVIIDVNQLDPGFYLVIITTLNREKKAMKFIIE